MRKLAFPRVPVAVALIVAGVLAATAAAVKAPSADALKKVKEDEAKRVAVIEKVLPSVAAVFAAGGQGGGSGVLISDDGYALTNFHVVQGSGPIMQCGLPDGVLYNGVVVGIDKVGDVALIKLYPKMDGDKIVAPKGGKFPFAKMGDSDKLKAGDWSLAMGNPFLLATDFKPTVTYGLISGVHRYQGPAGIFLEYTDCIQIDTSINPGNSGGPLFNMDGELVGINGRGSFEKRGRVNSGVGYAISINQIKNFMGHLRAGLDADHASLGAEVRSDSEEGGNGRMLVAGILEDSDAFRRGLDSGDEVIAFAGRPLASTNHYKNVLGLYPRGWRLPLIFRHETEKKESVKKEVLVRLSGVQRRELEEKKADQPKPGPRPQPRPIPNSPVAKYYQPKKGFTNYYFNLQERKRLLEAFRKHGSFAGLGPWTLDGTAQVKKAASTFRYVVREVKDTETNETQIRLSMDVGIINYKLTAIKEGQDIRDMKEPAGSGGLIVALYHYWQFLTTDDKDLGKIFEDGFYHGGYEPFYPPPADGKTVDYKKQRVDCEVIVTGHNGADAKWYFSMADKTLLGFEILVDKDDDPCEVYLSDYKKVDGRMLPQKMDVFFGNNHYGILNIKSYKFAKAK
jgi:S1-C subfamily serine protease